MVIVDQNVCYPYESDKGLEVLAFPCNNFGSQEPGSNDQIQDFIKARGITFKVLGKVECDNGAKTAPIYQYLKSSLGGGILGSGLKWNFAKFLCDENGVPVQRYLPTTRPNAIEGDILKQLEK